MSEYLFSMSVTPISSVSIRAGGDIDQRWMNSELNSIFHIKLLWLWTVNREEESFNIYIKLGYLDMIKLPGGIASNPTPWYFSKTLSQQLVPRTHFWSEIRTVVTVSYNVIYTWYGTLHLCSLVQHWNHAITDPRCCIYTLHKVYNMHHNTLNDQDRASNFLCRFFAFYGTLVA